MVWVLNTQIMLPRHREGLESPSALANRVKAAGGPGKLDAITIADPMLQQQTIEISK